MVLPLASQLDYNQDETDGRTEGHGTDALPLSTGRGRRRSKSATKMYIVWLGRVVSLSCGFFWAESRFSVPKICAVSE